MGEEGGSGSGAGYNIPISLSSARTTSLNPNQIAGTVINFGSGDASGGWYDQTASPYQPATAVSSAAQRDASSNLGALPDQSVGIDPKMIYGLAIGGIVLVIAAIYLTRK